MNKKLLLEDFLYVSRKKLVTIFWITATDARAARIMYLEKTKAITRLKNHPYGGYPNCWFRTSKKNFKVVMEKLK